jgi:C4-dicarboxylate transporter, DctM subunit
MEWATAGFVFLFVLLFLGVPIGFAMAFVGVAGYAMLSGWGASFLVATEIITRTAQSYEFSVIPLFILMGNLITRAQVSQQLYDASYAFLGARRGGLAMATIVACTGFSAVCGSSMATAATMSKVAMPEMKRYGYAESLAAGSVAAGGTLGILIPPSAALILYGIITRTDISKLFIAGIIPGLLGMVCYLLAIVVQTRRNAQLGPPGEPVGWAETWHRMKKVWVVVALFLLILGGLYFGIFSATEAAGVGAACAFLFALARGTLTVANTLDVFVESALTTIMIFVILFGALVFANLMNISGVPNALADWVKSVSLTPLVVILAIMLVYIILGCVLESISMMLLTVPIFFPVISNLGIDPVWFGIIVVVAVEISLITPPVGLNIFVLKAVQPDIPILTLYRGIIPFVLADFVRLAILIAFPALTLFLPRLMG